MMDYTISKRGVNRGTAIVGKSTNNQIQCLWKDVFEGVFKDYVTNCFTSWKMYNFLIH